MMTEHRHSLDCCAVLACWLLGIAAAGCGPQITRNPVPANLIDEAQPVGICHVRAWGGQYSPLFQADMVESIGQVRSYDPAGLVDQQGFVDVLALSGGGAQGAYGAGLLSGWTAAGGRPKFKLVTGISTGALTAPFAFLGPEYDEVLKNFYTTISTPDVYTERPKLGLLFGADSLADTAPLARLIAQSVDAKVLAAVAQEHRKGRRLYVGTANLDAGRLVVWNMGAIAASGHPNALHLFREVLRASASIPVAFQPVIMPVEADGKRWDEMHADGGTMTQVFFYGFMLDLAAAAKQADVQPVPIRIFVIRNAQIKANWQAVKPLLLPIAGRTVSQLLFTQGVGDLYRIYAITQQDGIDYNLATIPDSFESHATQAFDPKDMTRLFDLGYQQAADGYPWQKTPPGMHPETGSIGRQAIRQSGD